ncbi:ISAs1 family transposase [Nocardia sp. NPDC006982]|uniref:ISAs1 family transposase n=1 Tax=Nocardia sp. NPDC006982 TaxID=3364307 RepID=UPI0036916EA6
MSFDGKSLRGARDGEGRPIHLLSGVCQHLGVILGQIGVDIKTNEIPMLRELLAGIDIDGVIITADALHTNRDTATYITDLGGHYLLTVKDNQPKLRKALKKLPWHSVRTHDRTRSRRHGREETRTLKALAIRGRHQVPRRQAGVENHPPPRRCQDPEIPERHHLRHY